MTNLPLRAAAAIVLLLLLAQPAHAQVANPAVTVAAASSTLSLGANNTTTLKATITNTGNTAGAVTMVVSAPQGWNATVDPSSAFALPSGQAQTVTITLVAPAAATGAATGDLKITANMGEQTPAGGVATGRSATASASVSLTRVDPIVPPPPPPPYGQWALAAALSLLVVASVVYAERRRIRLIAEAEARRRAEEAAFIARETGIAIRLLDAPRRFGLKRELVVRVELKNVSERPRIAVVDSVETPPGWRATPSRPKVPLSPGETATVTFHMEPDQTVAPGTPTTIHLRGKPEEAQVRDERVALQLDAPEVLIPPPTTKSVTMHRESIVAPRPALRL